MTTKYPSIPIDHEQIAGFCRRHGVRRLSLFGSILRPDFSETSDVDVLIEFEGNQSPSLLDLGGMQVELSEIFGREADLKTPGFLPDRIRKSVMSEAVVQYPA